MFFVTLEDLQGRIELLVFPKILERTSGVWKEDNIVIAEGKLSDKEGVFKLIVDDAKIINQMELENFKRILATQKANGKASRPEHSEGTRNNTTGQNSMGLPRFARNDNLQKIIISLPANSTQETIKKLSAYFDQCEAGAIKVYLNINGAKLETPYCIKNKEGLRSELKRTVPDATINVF